MKREYTTPEIEMIKLTITSFVLALSDPEPTDSGGGYTPSDPEDPFSTM